VEQIGRYRVERLLAKGGMAEVFLGQAEGPGGFSKNVVIKQILPEHAQEPAFVQMFLDEARLAALLNHHNIVQIFDFGQHEGSYFIAMEYIEGESLRTIHRHYMAANRYIPQRFVAQIMIGVCEGLHYAHHLVDANGASYNIVHRDISPDNILVSTTGTAKVVDFGIAKAASLTAHQTDAGKLKGKYAYVAPEQIRGEGADRRSDVYALGVMLFELLTGQRPFTSDNELALLAAVLQARVPQASEVNPKVGSQLSKIVAKAMARNRDERYPDARSLQTDLERLVSAAGKRLSSAELAELVTGVSRARKALLPPDSTPSGPKGVPGFSPSGVHSHAAVGPQLTTPAGPLPPPAAPPATEVPGTEMLTAVSRPRRWKGGVGALLIGAIAVIAIGLLAHRPPPADPAGTPPPERSAPAPPSLAATPTPAASPAPIPVPSVAPTPVQVATPTPVVTPAPTPIHRPTTSRSPSAPVASSEEPTSGVHPSPGAGDLAGQEGFLTLRSDPWCDVYLDGTKIGMTPLFRAPVPAGPHELTLRNDVAGARRQLSVEVAGEGELKETIHFPHGFLVVRAKPWAQVFLDGRPLGVTPLQPQPVVEGPHQVRLVNPELQRDETRSVDIHADAQEVVKAIWD
jgi:serine/threonine protein kinase